MDNNLMEMLIKMMSGGGLNNQFQNQSQNQFQGQNQSNNTIYPQDNFEKNVQQHQSNFQTQNNILPLLLSLLNKNPSANIFSGKKDENKKAEVSSSALDDDVLL